ncbi:WapI family immunity protein [Spirosoma rhododendri]|uniref:Uncharacterized protein n=1 Tax=Spirosoma rhododendri TaxID=2728024 RepID=A0A7L5DW82_9BACT|nr:hypothetical protein [Spirosoma rhododendri]QJD80237.1 hypothetical protein HH216_18795 [Spirosoma rhododendri]
MRLTGNQSFFELQLIGVQYGQQANDPPLLEVAVRSGWHQRRSAGIGTLLHTNEVVHLIDWLRQAGKPHTLIPRLLFSDASLAFDCVTADVDECLLQVKLDQELTPAWHLNSLLPFWIPLLTKRQAIFQAADELQQQFYRLVGKE